MSTSPNPQVCTQEGPSSSPQVPGGPWSHCFGHTLQAEPCSQAFAGPHLAYPCKCARSMWIPAREIAPPLEAVTSLLQFLTHSPAVLPVCGPHRDPQYLYSPSPTDFGGLCAQRLQWDLSAPPQAWFRFYASCQDCGRRYSSVPPDHSQLVPYYGTRTGQPLHRGVSPSTRD